MCYSANNFGLGGQVYVEANPDELVASGTKLLRSDIDKQVAPWVATNMYTTGVGKDPNCVEGSKSSECKAKRGTFKMYVEGSWFPWGKPKDGGKVGSCGPVNCSISGGGMQDSNANNSTCFTGDGKRVNKGTDYTNVPCELSGGWGLYGLLALERNGVVADPNISADIAEKPPAALFRTYRIAPLQSDKEGDYFILDFSQQCNALDNRSECLTDKNTESTEIVSRGRVYFQIKDTNYIDNVGGYFINIVSGVFVPDGFIEKTVKTFEKYIDRVVQGIYQNIVHDTKIVSGIKAMLILYMTLYGLQFMIGLAEARQQDVVVRLFKVGLIVTLISDGSWEFFNNHLFVIFKDGAQNIADVVLNASLYYNNDYNSPRFILPENATVLSIYDILVQMLISEAIHAKIWGLTFYSYFVVYIPFLYVALAFLFIGIIRAMVLYFTAIMLIAVLLVTAPIFMVMMLYQITRHIFDAWLTQLISAGMVLVVVSATMALLVLLMLNQIENLFSFGVCWDYIFSIFTRDPGFLNWYEFYWWHPSESAEVEKCITPINFLAFFFVTIIFNKVMKDIPGLVDALSASELMPISRLAGGMESTFRGSIAPKVMAVAETGRAVAGLGLKGIRRGSDAALTRIPIVRAAYNPIKSAAQKVGGAYQAVSQSKLAGLVKGGVKLAAGAPGIVDNAMRAQDNMSKTYNLGQATEAFLGHGKKALSDTAELQKKIMEQKAKLHGEDHNR
jgi:type IV secretion system protein VirB6